jgi:tetratricopeptide (TPR) repeat protein
LTFYNNRGGLAFAQNNVEEAEEYYQRVLSYYKDPPEKNEDPDMARCYYNLGQCFEQKKDLDRALESYDTACRIGHRVLFERHPDLSLFRDSYHLLKSKRTNSISSFT